MTKKITIFSEICISSTNQEALRKVLGELQQTNHEETEIATVDILVKHEHRRDYLSSVARICPSTCFDVYVGAPVNIDDKRQCANCCRFGHAGENCVLPATCLYCAKQHAPLDCNGVIQYSSMYQLH